MSATLISYKVPTYPVGYFLFPSEKEAYEWAAGVIRDKFGVSVSDAKEVVELAFADMRRSIEWKEEDAYPGHDANWDEDCFMALLHLMPQGGEWGIKRPKSERFIAVEED